MLLKNLSYPLLKASALLLILAIALAGGIFAGTERAEAQPPFPIIYSGRAFIGTTPAPDGTKITATVGGRPAGRATEVKDGRYEYLVVDPSLEYQTQDEVIGLPIHFYANGVIAVETDTYKQGTFLEFTLDLHFAALPETGDVGLTGYWPVGIGAGLGSLLAGLFLLRLRNRRSPASS